ncbi:unnamed protein product, partial [Amoebophrya sp. A25]
YEQVEVQKKYDESLCFCSYFRLVIVFHRSYPTGAPAYINIHRPTT